MAEECINQMKLAYWILYSSLSEELKVVIIDSERLRYHDGKYDLNLKMGT